jgi:hypothetical protein
MNGWMALWNSAANGEVGGKLRVQDHEDSERLVSRVRGEVRWRKRKSGFVLTVGRELGTRMKLIWKKKYLD